MFDQSTVLRCAVLCMLFFFPIQAASSTLSKPLLVSKEQRSDDAITIAIEDQAYHRTLLLVSGYTRQHPPRYKVHDLEKIIADYCYEKPKVTPQLMANRGHKWCACLTISLCSTFLIGVTAIFHRLYPHTSLDFQHDKI